VPPKVPSDTMNVMSSASPTTENTLRIGKYVREAREAAGLSQRQLADRLGCQQPAISRLEAGGVAPGVVTLNRIASALGLELEIGMVSRDRALSTGLPVRFRAEPLAEPVWRSSRERPNVRL